MRQLLVVALGCSLLGMGELAAEDLAALRPTQRKAAIERKLDQPLEWNLADREHATLAELIAFVQEKHGLKIRWDTTSLALFYGEQAPLAGLLPVAASQPTYTSSPYPSAAIATAPAVAPSAAPAPSPTAPRKPEPDKPQPAPLAPLGVPPSAPSPYPPSPAPPNAASAVPPPLPPAPAKPEADRAAAGGAKELIAAYAAAPIAVSAVSLEQATVREGLQQLLAALPTAAGASFSIGIPMTTRALNLDLLVDENSVLITTQLRANAAKETRVYQLGALGEMPPETLVRVITHSVRPWSWRSQVHEIAEQLASRWPKTPLPLPKVELNLAEGVKLAASDGAGAPLPASTLPADSEEAVAATGQLLAGGAVAAVDSLVAALEIVHHGDPPTGVIETLPGMLVITQSQGAHREIEALLDALRDGN